MYANYSTVPLSSIEFNKHYNYYFLTRLSTIGVSLRRFLGSFKIMTLFLLLVSRTVFWVYPFLSSIFPLDNCIYPRTIIYPIHSFLLVLNVIHILVFAYSKTFSLLFHPLLSTKFSQRPPTTLPRHYVPCTSDAERKRIIWLP